jgi:hypothetical protein
MDADKKALLRGIVTTYTEMLDNNVIIELLARYDKQLVNKITDVIATMMPISDAKNFEEAAEDVLKYLES